MDKKLIDQIVQTGANDRAEQAMRERRAFLLNAIDEVERQGQQIPEDQLHEMLVELFDLNVAIGDAGLDLDGRS